MILRFGLLTAFTILIYWLLWRAEKRRLLFRFQCLRCASVFWFRDATWIAPEVFSPQFCPCCGGHFIGHVPRPRGNSKQRRLIRRAWARAGFVALLVIASVANSQAESKKRIVLTAVHAAMRAEDVAFSCYNLANGGREDFLPWQSCRAIALYSVGMVGAQVGGDLLLHHFHHDRLAIINNAAFSVPVGVATVYNLRGSSKVALPLPVPVAPVPIRNVREGQ